MLILTRRCGEKIMIGDDIEISIRGIQGNQTHIGIEAPSTVKVHRKEIYEKIQDEKESENE